MSSIFLIIDSTVLGGKPSAYIPQDLLPYPSIQLDGLHSLLEKANMALGRLDGVSLFMPTDKSLFLYMHVPKEAVLSSQIEGTQSSLFDFLLFEGDETFGVPSHYD